MKKAVIAKYDTMHFGRAEMQTIFDQSVFLRQALRQRFQDATNLIDRVMGSVLTTASVFENSFRKAYLVAPVYTVSISNRRVLREQYEKIGLDLDRLIKNIRVLLELRHTADYQSQQVWVQSRLRYMIELNM